jgi:uncharacterized protein
MRCSVQLPQNPTAENGNPAHKHRSAGAPDPPNGASSQPCWHDQCEYGINPPILLEHASDPQALLNHAGFSAVPYGLDVPDHEMRQEHRAIVERSFAAISRGDLEGQLESCTDDMVLELPYADPPVRLEGKPAIRLHVGPALEVFSFRLHITHVYECVDPDVLLLEYTSEGKVTTTGKPYMNSYIGVIRFRDGLLCSHREYYNPLIAARGLSSD